LEEPRIAKKDVKRYFKSIFLEDEWDKSYLDAIAFNKINEENIRSLQLNLRREIE